jgi:ATP-dependent DNA helicase RecG
MEEYFLHEPIYEEPNKSAVKLTLRNNIVARKERETGRVQSIIDTDVFAGLNEIEEMIVRYIYNTGNITATKAASVIGRSPQTARKWLNSLLNKNVIEVHGSGTNDPKRYYTMK